MSTQFSVQMDEMLKILFHLSRKPTIHLVNGLFHEAFELHDQLTITHLNVEYTQKRLTNSYQTKRSDKVLQVKNNDDVFHYHLEFQLKMIQPCLIECLIMAVVLQKSARNR